MQIVQTATFHKAVKKLHANQKRDLDEAVKAIMADSNIGEAKVGDLADVRVHKFKMMKQLTLLAYLYEAQTDTLILLALASRENFYRDLRKSTR